MTPTVVPDQNGMATFDYELDETVRCLLLDVAATVGAAHEPIVLETAAKLHALDVGDPSIKCLEDVQQYFHDAFVDTTWPRVPTIPTTRWTTPTASGAA